MPRDINITPVLNGFICSIGCQTVVFIDRELMANEIARYYENPDEVEKEYISHAVNKTMQVPAQPVLSREYGDEPQIAEGSNSMNREVF